MRRKIGLLFIALALLSLAGGLFFGTIGALQFVYPHFLQELPFFKVRPLHVSLVVAWIFLASVGGIYYYLPRFSGLPIYSSRLSVIHFVVFLLTGLAIISCYFAGKFGGREYWEFPPYLAIPIVLSWFIFGLNYFRTVFGKKEPWPVYLWMWATGIFFFLFTFLESYLWVLPWFRENFVRDITMQWKSYGALTGSWNMLVYGTAIFVMSRISGNEKLAHSKLSFLLFFLGLVNLMFGWAHHIYIVPSAKWVRYLAYGVSMTELILLARIIWNWRSSLSEARKHLHIFSYRFMAAADGWILLNLIVAILISIPAINLFTHGTHVTVGHAMGSTIGINTMILISSCFFIAADSTNGRRISPGVVTWGFGIVNGALLIFWIALLTAGTQKGILVAEGLLPFDLIMKKIQVYLTVFTWSGAFLLVGFLMVILPLFSVILKQILPRNLRYRWKASPPVLIGEKLKKIA